MTTKPENIDTSAERVRKKPIAELMRDAAESLDVLTSSMALPERVVKERKADAKRIVAELYDTADEIERQEPVATLYSKGPGPIEVRFTESTEFGTKLPHGTRLFASPAPAIPEGWKLVPIEPSSEMMDAFCVEATSSEEWSAAPLAQQEEAILKITDCWSAMLAAAPQPAEQQPDATQLVEVLEMTRDRLESERRSGEFDPLIRDIDDALAPYRKGGEV